MRGFECVLVVLLALLVGGIDEAQAKCSLAPLEGESVRWVAYVCVQGSFADVDEVPSDAEWIEFTVSPIRVLPSDAFSRFRNLRRLTFYNCDLREVHPHAFRGLDNLEWLVISNTQIGLLRASIFRQLRNLKRLALDGAGLVYIEPEVFHNFHRLETLSLVDNDLDCLPVHSLGSLVNLKTVHIGRNPWLCDCRNSLVKFFDQRRIVHEPIDECVVRNDTTSTCRTRTRVYDCMAKIDYPQLPAPQATFTQIEKHNHGRFEWRDSVATGITNLDRLPDETSWVQIHGVEITKISRYTFFRFGNTLRSIELVDCGIREIEREAFAGLHKLERLILVGNGLVTVGHDWFRDLWRLQELILRGNAIERFEENALVHLVELKTLDIRENRLTCLQEDYLRGPVSLQRLEAAGNPWTCECKYELEKYLIRKRIGYDINSGRCEVRPPDHEYKFTWNSTSTGRIRWCWPSKTHWPPVPRPTLPPTTTTTTPKTIYTPPTRPPRTGGGCRVVYNSGQQIKIDSCLCTGGSLLDLANVRNTVGTIKFSNSVISTIHNDAFYKFGHYLRHLEFRECSIQKIENRAFHSLWSLETLVIRDNYLEVVRTAWFEQLTNLKTLDLARNRITRIESGVFDNLPYLIRLDVSDNLMNCISTDHLENLGYLKEMGVTGNPWTCLCATKLVQILKHGGVTCNCNPDILTHRNEGGWGCTDDNDPQYFTTSRSPTWPARTTQPTTTKIPPSSPRPVPSTTTAVAPTLPPGPPTGTCITSHETLEGGPWYNCGSGDISVLLHIPNYVTKIEIRDSYIPNLPATIFSRFENLTDLVLINCTLRDIDDRAFAGLTKLERITLRHNRFTTVKSGWFRETKIINSIDLSDNDITEIEQGSFVGLNYLEYLNLEGNAFRCIYTSCFTGLPRLATVEFGRNRLLSWRCWEELEVFLLLRGINYTNYNCPHNGRDIVKNVINDSAQSQPFTSGIADSADFHSANIFSLCLIVVLRFYA